jgi:hypothetical protein
MKHRPLSNGNFDASAPKPKDHTVNLIPAGGVAIFRWSDADAAGPEEVVKSESTSDNLEKKGEERHAISITDL